MSCLIVRCPVCKFKGDLPATDEAIADALFPFERHPDGSLVVDIEAEATETGRETYKSRKRLISAMCPACGQSEEPLEAIGKRPC